MQECPDCISSSVGIAIDVSVPNARNPVALGAEVGISLCVMRQSAVFTMLATVDFHNQLVCLADEIKNVTIDRRLSAKVIALAAPGSEPYPKLHFFGCHTFTK